MHKNDILDHLLCAADQVNTTTSLTARGMVCWVYLTVAAVTLGWVVAVVVVALFDSFFMHYDDSLDQALCEGDQVHFNAFCKDHTGTFKATLVRGGSGGGGLGGGGGLCGRRLPWVGIAAPGDPRLSIGATST